VAAWAARFLFTGETLNQRIGRLFCGERARVLIAQLMLAARRRLAARRAHQRLGYPHTRGVGGEPAGIPGSARAGHARPLHARPGVDGCLGPGRPGGAERFADYQQWGLGSSRNWQRARATVGRNAEPSGSRNTRRIADKKKKLSYKEARRIRQHRATHRGCGEGLQTKHDILVDPAIMSDGARLRAASLEMDAAQKTIDQLYARWAELEQRKTES